MCLHLTHNTDAYLYSASEPPVAWPALSNNGSISVVAWLRWGDGAGEISGFMRMLDDAESVILDHYDNDFGADPIIESVGDAKASASSEGSYMASQWGLFRWDMIEWANPSGGFQWAANGAAKSSNLSAVSNGGDDLGSVSLGISASGGYGSIRIAYAMIVVGEPGDDDLIGNSEFAAMYGSGPLGGDGIPPWEVVTGDSPGGGSRAIVAAQPLTNGIIDMSEYVGSYNDWDVQGSTYLWDQNDRPLLTDYQPYVIRGPRYQRRPGKGRPRASGLSIRGIRV